MAGHSKWANIKHRKAAADAKKGKVFTRLIKEITVAARLGGGDASMNPRLRLAIDKATDSNIPKDTIERAMKRGAGAQEGTQYDDVRYEGYGIGGAAVIVECMTDNHQRITPEIRFLFKTGVLGTAGSNKFLFDHVGLVEAHTAEANVDLEAVAIEAGAVGVAPTDAVSGVAQPAPVLSPAAGVASAVPV